MQDLSGKLRFNFKNEQSLRVLAKTLLKHDFDLDVNIPPGKLVPALPLRLNYIHWIEDLMEHGKIITIQGIDIGIMPQANHYYLQLIAHSLIDKQEN